MSDSKPAAPPPPERPVAMLVLNQDGTLSVAYRDDADTDQEKLFDPTTALAILVGAELKAALADPPAPRRITSHYDTHRNWYTVWLGWMPLPSTADAGAGYATLRLGYYTAACPKVYPGLILLVVARPEAKGGPVTLIVPQGAPLPRIENDAWAMLTPPAELEAARNAAYAALLAAIDLVVDGTEGELARAKP